jgi:20S proteasome alpha/beta subunit
MYSGFYAVLTARATLPRSVNASFSVSPERILTSLVEYAMEAISHAGTVLAVASKEGIAMAAEKVSQL